jgi:hypothetical protein
MLSLSLPAAAHMLEVRSLVATHVPTGTLCLGVVAGKPAACQCLQAGKAAAPQDLLFRVHARSFDALIALSACGPGY